MGKVIYLPVRLKLEGGGYLVQDTSLRRRHELARARAAQYAKDHAALMWPEDSGRRKEAEQRLAAEEYRKLMLP